MVAIDALELVIMTVPLELVPRGKNCIHVDHGLRAKLAVCILMPLPYWLNDFCVNTREFVAVGGE